MDNATAAVIVGVAKYGGEVVKPFLQNLFGPITAEAGTAIAAPLREYNQRRAAIAEAVISKAVERLTLDSVKPEEVPMYILQPLLEAASLQEDESLQATWANLLANSADPAVAPSMLPAFTEVLASLSFLEVRLLNEIYETGHWTADSSVGSYRFYRIDIDQALVLLSVTVAQYAVLADNLIRLNLVSTGSGYGARHVIGDEPQTRDAYDKLHLTAFGEAFVKACRRDSEPATSRGHLTHR
jgi:hypothetical protein